MGGCQHASACVSLCICKSPHFPSLPTYASAKQKPAEKPSTAGSEQDALPTHVEPMQVASAKVQQYSKCTVTAVSMHTKQFTHWFQGEHRRL